MGLGNNLLGGFQDHGDFDELAGLTRDIERERFNKRALGIPVTVSDGIKLEEMRKKNIRLQDRINRYALEKVASEVLIDESMQANNLLMKANDELLEEIKELKIEVDKIYNRFEILDL
jgi:hypothetical protein